MVGPHSLAFIKRKEESMLHHFHNNHQMDASSSRRRTNPSPPPLSVGREEDGGHHESENLDNVLQKHVAFFDRNKDGLVYPWETFQGFRAIGCGWGLSGISAIFINLALSHKTRPGKWPSPLFPIEVKNIQRGKHGSDSGVYDAKGRFVAEKFEEIFKRHAKTNANALTWDELMTMLKSNRQPHDYGGWFASWTEWKLLYVLCNDKKGLLQKETILGVYDGSLFEHMQKERQLTPSKD